MSHDGISECINVLNSKQREVVSVVLTLAKDYVKYDRHNVETVHMFFSGSGDKGKSHLVKVIYNATWRTFVVSNNLRTDIDLRLG